jgi:hypothetical protein
VVCIAQLVWGMGEVLVRQGLGSVRVGHRPRLMNCCRMVVSDFDEMQCTAPGS